MTFDRSFRFVRDELNHELINHLRTSGLDYSVDAAGKVHYRSSDEEPFEDVLAQIRCKVFADWQVLSFPQDSASRYRAALREHLVSYEEELNNDDVEFLLGGHHEPHSWKM